MSTPLSTSQFRGAGTKVTAPLSDTVFSQVDLDYEKVGRMKKKSAKSMPTPIAAVVNGTYIIQDGHHRTAAEISKGKSSVDLEVF